MVIKKGNQIYAYKTIREGDKTKKIYLGKILSPKSQAFLEEQKSKETAREARKQLNTDREAILQEADRVSDMVSLLVRLSVLLHGYYFRRSEIRKIRSII